MLDISVKLGRKRSKYYLGEERMSASRRLAGLLAAPRIALVFGVGLLCRGALADGAATFPVQTKTVDGITIKITDVHWAPYAEFPGIPSSRFAPPNVLTVAYEIHRQEAPAPLAAPDMGAGANVATAPPPFPGRRGQMNLEGFTQVWAVSPDGERSEGMSLQGRPGLRVWNSELGQVNPTWEPLHLEFDYIPPFRAQPGAGRAPESVTFTDLPLPTQTNVPLDLNQTRTTPAGVRITLLNIGIKPREFGPPGDSDLLVVGRWLPPDSEPGRNVEIVEPQWGPQGRLATLEYDTGLPVNDRSHRVQIGPYLPKQSLEPWLGYFAVYAPVPPADAKTATVRLTASERVPEGQYPASTPRTTFLFDVPRAAIALPAAIAPPAIAAQTTLGDGKLSLTSFRYESFNGYKYSWHAQMLLEMPWPMTWEHEWLAGARIFSEKPGDRGYVSGGDNDESRPRWSHWNFDNTPLTPNQTLYETYAQFMDDPNNPKPAPRPAPQFASIEIHWREVKRTHYETEFTGLPVPKAGEILTPEIAQPLGDLGQLIVRKVAFFDEAHTFSPLLSDRIPFLQPHEGLAVVLELVPAAGSPAFPWGFTYYNDWDFSTDGGKDDSGRALKRHLDKSHFSTYQRQDELDPTSTTFRGGQMPPQPKGYLLTMFLLPPTAGAHTFSLNVGTNREMILRKVSTKFTDVPLPPLPDH